jgi:hypothetical protein
MLNGGIRLMGVIKLLGHRDDRMTLRYTEFTLETLGEEYRAARRWKLVEAGRRYSGAVRAEPLAD